MYQPRTKGYRKSDPVMRWGLPDRVFFACGACQVLAYAFLTRYRDLNAKAIWIKPNAGHTGNHIFATYGDAIFDYHGYSNRDVFLSHYWKRATQTYPGWNATLKELPRDVLVSEAKSRTYDGLWLRQPDQFLHNAMPRAEAFLDQFPKPPKD